MAKTVEVICGRGCGFRVHSRYYEQKTRFAPGICARCNGPIVVVWAKTDVAAPGYVMGEAGVISQEGGD